MVERIAAINRSPAPTCATPPGAGQSHLGTDASFSVVIPAKAGIHWDDTTLPEVWTPAFAGMTAEETLRPSSNAIALLLWGLKSDQAGARLEATPGVRNSKTQD
jgi:hypothetical protein